MLRKVTVACVGIAALLVFARLSGSGGASGNAGDARPAAAAPAVAQIAALPAAAAQAVPAAGGPAGNRSRATPGTPGQTALDLLAGFTPAGAAATATAAAAPAPRPQKAEPTAMPTTGGSVRTATGPAVTDNDAKAAQPPAKPAANPDAPATLNGVSLSDIVVLPEGALDHARQIYALGQARGRNPRAFSKIGDSTMAFPPLLAAFDNPAGYRLGPYGHLNSTIERFAGSLSRESAAVKKGMHSWAEFDPAWVNSDRCQSGEGPLACELRLNNPSIVFIRLGTNDYNEPQQYRDGLVKILDYCLARGVVPVLGTKPDRLEGPQNTINQIVYDIARDYELPVWDYDRIAGTVPGKGLMSDGTHYLNNGSRDYGSKATFTTADSLEDLSALMMLDALSRELK